MNAEFYFNQGVEKSKNKDLVGAIDNYSKAIELSSSVTPKTISEKQPDGSVTHLNIFETNVGNVNMYFNRACAYFDIGKYQEAINDYDKIIEYTVNDAEVYFKRAIANYCIENDNQVEEDLKTAFKLDPKYSKELFLSQFRN